MPGIPQSTGPHIHSRKSVSTSSVTRERQLFSHMESEGRFRDVITSQMAFTLFFSFWSFSFIPIFRDTWCCQFSLMPVLHGFKKIKVRGWRPLSVSHLFKKCDNEECEIQQKLGITEELHQMEASSSQNKRFYT